MAMGGSVPQERQKYRRALVEDPDRTAKLCEDVAVWIESGSYPPDEIAARFHHRLVAIHLFPNGNGRHARTMTDLLLVQRLGRPRFSWGSGTLVDAGNAEGGISMRCGRQIDTIINR